MCNNVRGVKSKEKVIHRIVDEVSPTLVALVETKLVDKVDNFTIDGYVVRRNDRDASGGGVLVAFKRSLKNIITIVNKYKKHDCEMLWLKVDNGIEKIRIGVVYMPQESRTLLKDIKKIYDEIEKEIKIAEEHQERLLIMGDFNCKVGGYITGNKDIISKGGRVLLKLCEQNNLKILNGEKCCRGVWTRVQNEEKSVLDYVITRNEDVNLVNSMIIDQDRDITPYTLEIVGNDSNRVYSDHFAITCSINWKVEEKKMKYVKKLNKNKIAAYRRELEKQNVSSLIDGRPIRESYSEWNMKVLKIRDEFSVRRKTHRKWKVERLLNGKKREITRMLKLANDPDEIAVLKSQRCLLMDMIDEEQKKKDYTRINKIISDVEDAGGVNSTTFWKVRSRLMGRQEEIGDVMEDENGVLHEDPEEIKEIHARYYENLLKRTPSETVEGKETEEIVELIERGMEMLASRTMPQKSGRAEIELVVNKLDEKKARDAGTWSNLEIKAGGTEMIESLYRIFERMDMELAIAEEWEQMEIKPIHKKGQRTKMPNKRGLFLPNNIGKVYEKVVKGRNNEQFCTNITVWQNGGVRLRGPIDNTMLTIAIGERNKYLNRSTYLTFTDAEKCFDKLWLEDGINELWRLGTNVRDCIMIKRMNQVARIVVKTPLGPTREFLVERIVKQGTVYGPQICIGSMDKINLLGKDVVTFYGPTLPIRALAFVDDVTGAGGITTANSTIGNCAILEEKKKMTFNNTNEKTEYMVIPAKGDIARSVTAKVKRGSIQRVNEHKMLGTWIDETLEYRININKRKKNLQFMISTTKTRASAKNIGKLAVEGRLKLGESVVIQSLLHNAEAYHDYKRNEIDELEKMQGTILRQYLEVPNSTPYYGLLMETGWLTMEARLHYRKMMLFHNIMNSDERRVLKKLLLVQREENRAGTWYNNLCKTMEMYGIELNVEESSKHKWKNLVKEQIRKKTEEIVREECCKMTKARSVKDDIFELKQYLKDLHIRSSREILLYRLHMINLPMNFKNAWKQKQCPLCRQEEGTTEHYFSCPEISYLRTAFGVKGFEQNDPKEMANNGHFMQAVQTLLEPKCQ